MHALDPAPHPERISKEISLASGAELRRAVGRTGVGSKGKPDLVGQLAKELGSTPEQAAGAAGALFGVAKSRLKADEFSQVAKAVPGMDSLLKAAPSAGALPGGPALSQVTGTSGSSLASAASAFSKLGLQPDMAARLFRS